MAIVLYNPTHRLGEKYQETFRGEYSGISRVIKPGQKVMMDDKAANHLLHQFAIRGLCQLVYGDEERLESIEADGLDRNRKWKIKQINDINETNSNRKATSLPYLVPSKTLRLYAEELGEDLVEPYRIKDEQKKEMSDLRAENAMLKAQLQGLNDKFDMLLQMQAGKEKDIPPDTAETETPQKKRGRPSAKGG